MVICYSGNKKLMHTDSLVNYKTMKKKSNTDITQVFKKQKDQCVTHLLKSVYLQFSNSDKDVAKEKKIVDQYLLRI